MVDVERLFKNTVKNGTVEFGAKQTRNAIAKKQAKLVVIAKNCPAVEEITTLAKQHQIPVYNYTNSSVNLGQACGKQYPVSVFSVIDEGSSNIMHALKEKK